MKINIDFWSAIDLDKVSDEELDMLYIMADEDGVGLEDVENEFGDPESEIGDFVFDIDEDFLDKYLDELEDIDDFDTSNGSTPLIYFN